MAHRILPAVVMSALVILTFCPVSILFGHSALLGLDYQQLHLFRLRFAREMFFSHGLPGWYPRELLGGPFWANVLNFPLVPTRLLLFLVPPEYAFALGVNLSALLAAGFTYAFCRQLDFSRIASAGAGWTFACSGIFAANVLGGGLPNIEGYPALPFLLWSCERAFSSRALPELALAGFLVALCGHPQFPAYGLAVAVPYLWFRCRHEPRRFFVALLFLGCGLGLAAFRWIPMLELSWRSVRALPLNPAGNNVSFPYSRLLAFFAPWADGRLPPLEISSPREFFHGYPEAAYFWDTICYAGLLPWVGSLLWLCRERSGKRLRFLFVAGAVALVLALPLFQHQFQRVPGIVFRSPARQVYVTVFALSVGFAVLVRAFEAVGARLGGYWPIMLACLPLALQEVDLGAHTRSFVIPTGIYPSDPGVIADARKFFGPFRSAFDQNLRAAENREVDDVGVFNPATLARTYEGMLALSGAPPGVNLEIFDGKQLSRRALELASVKLVVTTLPRDDLGPDLGPATGPHRYLLTDTSPRAVLFPRGRIEFPDKDEIFARLRAPSFDPRSTLLYPAPPGPGGDGGHADYERPSPDRIVARASGGGGALRVSESWDPGWSATIDGAPLDVAPADGFLLGAWVPPGDHVIDFRYSTPGQWPGALLSLLFAAMLVVGIRHRGAW